MKRFGLIASLVCLVLFGAAMSARAEVMDNITLKVEIETGKVWAEYHGTTTYAPSTVFPTNPGGTGTWWSGLDVYSPSGQLLTGALIPFSTSVPGAGFGINTQGPTVISQASLSASAVTPVGSIYMGPIFTPNGTQDLRLDWLGGDPTDYFSYTEFDTPPNGVVYVHAEIPEPSTIVMLFGAVTAFGAALWRRRQA